MIKLNLLRPKWNVRRISVKSGPIQLLNTEITGNGRIFIEPPEEIHLADNGNNDWSSCPGTRELYTPSSVWEKICEYHFSIPHFRDSQITYNLIKQLFEVGTPPHIILNWAINKDYSEIEPYINKLNNDKNNM